MYVLSSICTAVPYRLGFLDISRRFWWYTVYSCCRVVCLIFGKGTTPRFILRNLFVYVSNQLGTTLYMPAARQQNRKQRHARAVARPRGITVASD